MNQNRDILPVVDLHLTSAPVTQPDPQFWISGWFTLERDLEDALWKSGLISSVVERRLGPSVTLTHDEFFIPLNTDDEVLDLIGEALVENLEAPEGFYTWLRINPGDAQLDR